MSSKATAGPRCPICGRATVRRWRPFCSRRCADTDLARWLDGRYSVPVVELDEDDLALPDEGERDDENGPDEDG